MNDEELKNETDDSVSEVDPWAAAFEAVNEAHKTTPETNEGAEGPTTEGADGEADSNPDRAITGEPEDSIGGLVPGAEQSASEAGSQEDSYQGRTQEEISTEIKTIKDQVRQAAIDAVYKRFMDDPKIRKVNGKLGATINDPDIVKYDRDGVPTFYNPETGRPFTGDDPREQAREWVNRYNQRIQDDFNSICAQSEAQLLQEAKPVLDVLEFEPTYNSLDPIRKAMFENLIEDYEIMDKNGDVIGYSCDLNKALAAVNRQVKAIQTYSKNSNPAERTTPALDMKNSTATNDGERREPKSLEEAMEMYQNDLLSKKGKK